MKLIIILIALTILSLQVIGKTILKEQKIQVNTATSRRADYTKQWQTLLTTMERPPQLCDKPERLMNGPDEYEIFNNNATEIFTPAPKANRFAKQQGYGPSAYLFDYFDQVFQKPVLDAFKKMWQAGKSVKADPKFEDPYNIDKLIFYYSQGAAGSLNSTGQNQNPEAITRYNNNFNPSVWSNGITIPQVDTILKEWGWRSPDFTPDPAKKLVDKFDFDGDGRLNPSEFILLSIVNNVHYFNQVECKQNCYQDIFANLIDPLFVYLDCDKDGYVSAENMWVGLPNLKRTNPDQCNMYRCRMPTVLNKGYRTTSCNDFILKNFNRADGFVTLDEFRAGILLGYWDRHTDINRIIEDDSKTLKKNRWGENFTKDIVCDRVLALTPRPTAIPLVQNSPR